MPKCPTKLLPSGRFTVWMGWMAHRKWKEIKQQPGTAGPNNMLGCCLVSFQAVQIIKVSDNKSSFAWW